MLILISFNKIIIEKKDKDQQEIELEDMYTQVNSKFGVLAKPAPQI